MADILNDEELNSTVVFVEQNLVQKSLLSVLKDNNLISNTVTELNFEGDLAVVDNGNGKVTVSITASLSDADRFAQVAYMLKTESITENPDGSISYDDYEDITNLIKTFPLDGTVVFDYDFNGQHYQKVKGFA